MFGTQGDIAMRSSLALSVAAAGLIFTGSVRAQDTPAPADSNPPADTAAPAEAAPAADAGATPPPVMPAQVDASAPPSPTVTGDPLAGIRDVDYFGIMGNGDRPDTRRYPAVISATAGAGRPTTPSATWKPGPAAAAITTSTTWAGTWSTPSATAST